MGLKALKFKGMKSRSRETLRNPRSCSWMLIAAMAIFDYRTGESAAESGEASHGEVEQGDRDGAPRLSATRERAGHWIMDRDPCRGRAGGRELHAADRQW